jgi:hypothetical protein
MLRSLASLLLSQFLNRGNGVATDIIRIHKRFNKADGLIVPDSSEGSDNECSSLDSVTGPFRAVNVDRS